MYHTKTADTVSCKSLKTSAIEWAHSIVTMRHAVAIVFLLLTFIQICKNRIRWCKLLCASALSILSYFSFFFFFSVRLPSRTSYHMSVLESMEIVILRTFQCAYACVFPYTTSKLLDKCPIGIKFLFFREIFSIKAEKRTRCDRKDHKPSG